MMRFAKPSRDPARVCRTVTLLRWQANRRPWLALYVVNANSRGLAGEADIVSMCELLDVAEHRGHMLVLCRVPHLSGRRWAVCFGVPKARLQ